jgi:hypothetical protein
MTKIGFYERAMANKCNSLARVRGGYLSHCGDCPSL